MKDRVSLTEIKERSMLRNTVNESDVFIMMQKSYLNVHFSFSVI
jgi:hypothetical protein